MFLLLDALQKFLASHKVFCNFWWITLNCHGQNWSSFRLTVTVIVDTAIQKVFANINVTKTTNQLQKLVLRKTVAPQTSRDDILQQAVSESNCSFIHYSSTDSYWNKNCKGLTICIHSNSKDWAMFKLFSSYCYWKGSCENQVAFIKCIYAFYRNCYQDVPKF